MPMTRREFHKKSFALGAATALGSMRVLGANEQCVGDAELNKLLTKPYRAPWALKGL